MFKLLLGFLFDEEKARAALPATRAAFITLLTGGAFYYGLPASRPVEERIVNAAAAALGVGGASLAGGGGSQKRISELEAQIAAFEARLAAIGPKPLGP